MPNSGGREECKQFGIIWGERKLRFSTDREREL
jgi:hypothetical protein